ncbi:MAG: PAS domain-containing protein [Bacteroidales bacterium]|jgi:PAS domain S-box-containing protein|nr:PAS domain-containing protein [Bacteroidales bacterium]MDD3701586.1 PAS domain-containing protein [Bacteroidales bacterium]MDY0370197.1 PAS domain-containing protein [Bacteroidales bacterium]
MVPLTQSQEKNLSFLLSLFKVIEEKQNAIEFIRSHTNEIEAVTAFDIMLAVDRLTVIHQVSPKFKQHINKFMNVLGTTVKSFDLPVAPKDSLMDVLLRNYRKLELQLIQLKPLIRKLNSNSDDEQLKQEILEGIKYLNQFIAFYEIKENILFPLMEQKYQNYKCLSVMWSFHDDIRRHLKASIDSIQAIPFNLKVFNRNISDAFFTIYAIKLRDERILFPEMVGVISDLQYAEILQECIQMGLPYYEPTHASPAVEEGLPFINNKTDLQTGLLEVQEIIMLFKHLPVDITYVDAQDKVRFYSDPPHRIFPRSKAVIGRDVRNCHPPESVHMVEEIIQAFREGRKHDANFWITMKGRKIMIQYFALRDEAGKYQGVMEVSQDITAIQQLQGEKRLLDWRN